jgi:hypothetical protein
MLPNGRNLRRLKPLKQRISQPDAPRKRPRLPPRRAQHRLVHPDDLRRLYNRHLYRRHAPRRAAIGAIGSPA